MKIKVIVGAADSNGSAVIIPVIVECSEDAYNLGNHYDVALIAAEDKGYETSDWAADEHEPAFKLIGDKFNWDEAIKSNLSRFLISNK